MFVVRKKCGYLSFAEHHLWWSHQDRMLSLNQLLGSQVARAVVVRAREDLTAEEVSGHVASRAARHKHLQGGVIFTEAIPR